MSDLTPGLVAVWDTDSPEGVDAFPDNTAYFLDYDDGNPISQYILQRFPKAIGITITTVPEDNNFDARLCDTEETGFSIGQTIDWVSTKIERGTRPGVYVEVSEKPELEGELAASGFVFDVDVDCAYAWWNGIPNIANGIFDGVACGVGNVGHQFFNDGDLYDTSVFYEAWILGPWPPPPPPKETKVEFIKEKNGEVYWFVPNGTASYWRLVPAALVASIPGTSIIDDPTGAWLALWLTPSLAHTPLVPSF